MNKHQLVDLIKNNLHIRKKPLVLQMPITSRCNSRCKTCNVWKHKRENDINAEKLANALSDDFFSEVVGVGLNGGELTLVPDFLEILKSVLMLPRLRGVYLISNGLFPKRLFEYLLKAKKLCDAKGVRLHICISVDGFEKTHEFVRGVPNCFVKTQELLDELETNWQKYCSSYSVSCTISIYNIDTIKETKSFLSKYLDLYVEYHIAVPNKRIKTFDDADYYLLNDDRRRLLATEFFHELFRKAKTRQEKFQYFSNYYFLKTKGLKRISRCDYTNRDVTIDENLHLSLCATASEIIGDLTKSTATELIRSDKTKKVWHAIKPNCNSCGHYLENSLTLRGKMALIHEEMKMKFALEYYSLETYKTKILKWRKRLGFLKRYGIEYLRYIYRYLWKLQ